MPTKVFCFFAKPARMTARCTYDNGNAASKMTSNFLPTIQMNHGPLLAAMEVLQVLAASYLLGSL